MDYRHDRPLILDRRGQRILLRGRVRRLEDGSYYYGYGGAGTITQSYSTGAVSGSSNTGGFAGWNSGSITSSFWDTSTNAPGLPAVGNQIETPGVTGLTTAQFGNISYFQNAGWSFGTTAGGAGCGDGGGCWAIVDNDGSLNNTGGATGATRPMLLSEWSTTITNAHQLQLVVLNPSASYTLANNIDLAPALANASDVWGPNGATGFVPIGNSTTNFTGTFNGQGNAISNLVVNLPTNTTAGSYAGDVRLHRHRRHNHERQIARRRSVTGENNVGALVGQNNGTLTQSYASVTVVGASNVGGLVGVNGGSVTQSYAAGSVNGVTNVGGLAGLNGGSIAQAYATGDVTGTNNVGGLIGYNSGSFTIATYDVAAAFEQGWLNQTNPNGVWSYGYSSGFTGPISLYSQTVQNGVNGSNAQYWLTPSVDAGTSPAAEFNHGAGPVNGNVVNFLPNRSLSWPGSAGNIPTPYSPLRPPGPIRSRPHSAATRTASAPMPASS